jgi:hypothetical protein
MPPNKHRVHFLNIFLFLAGPEGLGEKNFKIRTQYKSHGGPKELHADIGYLKRLRCNRHWAS